MRTPFLLACSAVLVPALGAQTIEPPFSADYELVDLGMPDAIPGNLGGITIRRDQPGTLYVVGQATRAPAAVYRVPVTRADGHVAGFGGPGVFHAAAPNADGGLQFGPGGVLFFTRYSMNELGQIRPGSVMMDKSVLRRVAHAVDRGHAGRGPGRAAALTRATVGPRLQERPVHRS